MKRYKYIMGSMLAAGFIFFSSCSGRQPHSSTGQHVVQTSLAKTDTGHAVIRFDIYQHDFGKMAEGDIISYTFRFTNTGTGNLVIKSASASCGCTIPKYSKEPVKPGGTGEMEVVFNSEGEEGIQHKTIAVRANTRPPVTLLTITADVAPKGN